MYNTFIENLADSLYQNIEKVDREQEVNYQVYIDTKNSYDVLVNDLLVSYDYGSIKQKNVFFVNKAILKSGKQKLQIKFYPEYQNDEFLETLTNNDFLVISVESYTWGQNGWKENKKEILRYELPILNKDGNKIDYSQKKELIIDLEFEAQVPYDLKGWTEGVLFNKRDSVELKQKLAAIYQQRIEDFKDKRFEKIKKESLQREFEQIQFYYLPKDEFVKRFSDYQKEENDIYFPLENYDIFFYGNNKVITLRRIDKIYKGDGALIYESTDNKQESWITSLDLFFYQPQGSNQLVLIR